MPSKKREETVHTKHPQGKSGVNISREKYDTVRGAILAVLEPDAQLTHTELTRAVEKHLGTNFDGSIAWYTECVKLDLEARGDIKRLDDKPSRWHAK